MYLFGKGCDESHILFSFDGVQLRGDTLQLTNITVYVSVYIVYIQY